MLPSCDLWLLNSDCFICDIWWWNQRHLNSLGTREISGIKEITTSVATHRQRTVDICVSQICLLQQPICLEFLFSQDYTPTEHHRTIWVPYIVIIFVWRKQENISPCTGSRMITSFERIASSAGTQFRSQTSESQGNSAALYYAECPNH